MVKARRAWNDAQTRCMTFLPSQTSCQHREHGLYQHAVLPLSTLAQFEVALVPLRRMEAGVAQDNHPLLALADQPLESLVCSIRGLSCEAQHTIKRDKLNQPGGIDLEIRLSYGRVTAHKGGRCAQSVT
jgi:hypothetical protein